MSKREQALSIEPKNEIHFKGPYNRVVTEYFKLSNPTDRPIAFKVKTTAPKRYCVRPNNGTIAPGKNVSVAVMLQPLASGDQPSALEKNKHKFMIQSVFVATEAGNADDLFKSVPVDEIMDSKFRCVFDDNTAAALSAASASLKGVNAGSDSENDIQGGDKMHLSSSDPYSSGSYGTIIGNNTTTTSNEDVSSSHAVSSLATAPDSSLLNGGDDDHYGGYSTSSVGATTVVESSAAAADVKRLLEENRELKVKLQELERASRAGPYNRFGQPSSASSQQSSSSQQKSSSPAQAATQQQQGGSLLDQPLSPQVIFTVLVSILIGFILGKLEIFF